MVLLKELFYVLHDFVPVTQNFFGFCQPEIELNYYFQSKQIENVHFVEEFPSVLNEFHNIYLDVDVLAENGLNFAGQKVLPWLVVFALCHQF